MFTNFKVEHVRQIQITSYYNSAFANTYRALHDTMNLKEVQKKLSDVFTNELPSDTKKRLECEFHSTNYDDLMKVITALKTVCDYLVKVCCYITSLYNLY